jgi:putative membrane protein
MVVAGTDNNRACTFPRVALTLHVLLYGSGQCSRLMRMRFLLRLGITAAALWISAEVIPDAQFDGRLVDLLVLALIFGLVNALIRPVVRLLTLPINVLTLGLFTLVVNGFMLLITSNLSDSLNFDGGFFSRLGSAILASIVVSIVSVVLSLLLPDGR